MTQTLQTDFDESFRVDGSWAMDKNDCILTVVKLLRQRFRVLNLKKLESKNEITIVSEYNYERQRVCEHRHNLLSKKWQQPHAEMEEF